MGPYYALIPIIDDERERKMDHIINSVEMPVIVRYYMVFRINCNPEINPLRGKPH